MNQLSTSSTKTFNLLSIGQRGVGKTVFLAGSYTELHSAHQTKHQKQLWFDCQNSQGREKIEKILSYVAQSGQYPPPTMKITNFNLSLKRHSLRGVQTLCHFRWWDIPGEYCNIHHPDFKKLVLTSHGCCVFINADALVRDPAYLQALEDMIKQVVTVASLVDQHNLKYPFALIFTKYDLLDAAPLSLLEIEEKVQPLLARLQAVKAHYKRFYSAIPIVSHAGAATLEAKGAAASLLWLVSELRKLHNQQPGQELGTGLMQSLTNSPDKASTVEKLLSLNLSQSAFRNIFLSLTVVSIGLVGVGVFLLFAFSPFTPAAKQAQNLEQRLISEYEQILQQEPDNFHALINLAKLYIQQGQPDRAIPLMEKLERVCKLGAIRSGTTVASALSQRKDRNSHRSRRALEPAN